MANVFDVAKYILHKQGSLSTMKLQKLCYYAQAWSLVWDDEPLFQEEFQAWKNGPVCQELFDLYRGKFKIPENDIPNRKLSTSGLNKNQIETIDKVLDYYGDKDAQWLSSLTHLEDPWKEARGEIDNNSKCDNIITKESMAMYYGGL